MHPIGKARTQDPVERAVAALRASEEILVPVKALWLDMQRHGVGLGLSLDLFTAMLQADSRLEMFSGFEHEAEEPGQQPVMEEFGFDGGPRAKLADRELTPDHVARMLRHSTQAMLDALEGAWATMPHGDPEAEQDLLTVLTMAERLKHEMDMALSDVGGDDGPGD